MMEMATDIMAILGWALFGICVPAHIIVFRNGEDVFKTLETFSTYMFASAISFGLIAASIVLG